MTPIQSNSMATARIGTGGMSAQASTTAAENRYAADWAPQTSTPGARAAGPVTTPVATPQREPLTPEAVHERALLAADVYNDRPSPPDGYRVATPAELNRLGLNERSLDPGTGGFRARVYAADDGGFVVAFRGTQGGADWVSNAQQGVGMASDHYRRALEIGDTLAQARADVALTGHSLGGGLAAAASLASGAPATTFNAAGLHVTTVASASGIARNAGVAPGQTDNFRVPGEVLTLVQEDGDRVIGGLIGGAITRSGLGARAGAAILDLPAAYGRQHDLPDVAPEGVGFFGRLNIVDRHSMDWVIAGAAARMR